MEGYGPETYGDRIAGVYDAQYETTHALDDTPAAVETLAQLADAGPVLELAIGTGRLALPLAERGLDVHGIDASEQMVAKLREKAGGDRIPVSMGDFANVGVEGEFSLIFVAFNTFFALRPQDDQLRCFQNVAAHLADGGVFVIEAFVPDLALFDRGQRMNVNSVEVGRVVLDASRHDPLAQRVDTQHIVISSEETHLYPVSLRYAFPSELDLMARLAGLELRDRWGGWQREPFTASSGRHISLYGR
ncbi:MAG: class I SAM-dependent DNA methyltransferase [Candidatus Dormibacteria bacterium]